MTPDNNQHYWMSPEELSLPAPSDSVPERDSEEGEWSRRSFLAAAGFGGMSALLAGCSKAPVKKAIPFLAPIEEVVPGRAIHYASTCGACEAGCGLMIKNRDGRPIKLEGFRGAGGSMDRTHPISAGGLCAIGQASLLGLYDSHRLQAPSLNGKEASWEEVDQHLATILSERQDKGVAILTNSITSLTTKAAIDRTVSQFAGSGHYVYDTNSCSALLDAHERCFGVRALPRFHFDRAQTVLGVGCDFLGTWVSPVEFAADYATLRSPGADLKMSWHGQVEGQVTVTGTKADLRAVRTESEQVQFLVRLAAHVAERVGQSVPSGWPTTSGDEAELEDISKRLLDARGQSLVVTGLQHQSAQMAAIWLNQMLGNYGKTLDMERPSFQRQGSDQGVVTLIERMEAGAVKTLIIRGANPAYDLPEADRFKAALEQVDTVVCIAMAPNETTAVASVVCPEPHFLESWDDAQPVAGVLAMTQPALSPLFDTRPFRDSLLKWCGDSLEGDEVKRLQAQLQKLIPGAVSGQTSFNEFWQKAVHDGVMEIPVRGAGTPSFNSGPLGDVAADSPTVEGFELQLFEEVGLRDGRHAHNAWLQEMPDPITKVSWGHVALLGVNAADRLGVKDGDIVSIEGDAKLELPARIQPGQHDNVVAVALGYGRAGTNRFHRVGPDWIEAEDTVSASGVIGLNAFGLLNRVDGTVRTSRAVTVTKTGRSEELALAQTWGSIDVPANTAPGGIRRRPQVVSETTIGKLKHPEDDHHHGHHDSSLWSEDHESGQPQWAMSIDLNKCNGCSACVVACQVENNIPVVGRDEVRRRRDMYWLRIDRYYSGEPEVPEDVDFVHQPMLCHHCDHAPCETVCPVLATVHSEEGLNSQIYNRCVGTRYCANNCPYKVRRFNWFDYAHEDQLQNMALNPDITVRSKGVMEKCSFCVQRIQEAKAEAKRKGIPVPDGEIQPACQQTCPAQAITFGDRTKPENKVSQAMADPLHFFALDELNLKPSVGYRSVVRNRGHESK